MGCGSSAQKYQGNQAPLAASDAAPKAAIPAHFVQKAAVVFVVEKAPETPPEEDVTSKPELTMQASIPASCSSLDSSKDVTSKPETTMLTIQSSRPEDVISKPETTMLTRQSSLEVLKGTWRAVRLAEWGPCGVAADLREGYLVWDFDDQGNGVIHQCQGRETLQVRCSEEAGVFEGDAKGDGTAYTVSLKLEEDGNLIEWTAALGKMRTRYYFQRVSMEEWQDTPVGALHLAVERGDLEAVERILADAGVDVEALLLAADLSASTALHKCAYFNQAKVMQLILEKATSHDSLLHAVNNYKSTPLHAAAHAGSKQMCSLILQYATDPDFLLKQENKKGRTPFASAQEMPIAHFLCTYRESVSFQWPGAHSITADDQHLTMGMTAQCVEEGMDALKAETYVRDEDNLSWVTSSCGDIFTGYDNCALVKIVFLKSEGYSPYSMLEVMASCNHPGVGRADVFLSHAQREAVSLTLDCMRQYELRKEKPIKFFLDIYALRQCVHDFELPLVKQAIEIIGCTVMIVEPWSDPYTLSRVFCAFEVFVTVNAALVFEAVTPPSELTAMLSDMCSGTNSLNSVNVQIENAEARRPKDKAKIDKFISEGPGFELTNRLTGAAVRSALLIQAHLLETEGQLSVDMIGEALMDLGPEEAAKLIASEGANGQTVVHRLCTSSKWLQKLPHILGGRTQSALLAQDKTGLSPLIALIQADDETNIRHLLDAGEDADELMSQPMGLASVTAGKLPLMHAGNLGKLAACRALLAKASNPEALLKQTAPSGTYEGMTALMSAAVGQLKAFEFLLASSDDPEALVMQTVASGVEQGMGMMGRAVIGGSLEVAQLALATVKDQKALLHQRASSEARRGQTPLHMAALLGRMAICKLILQEAGDDTQTLLMYQCDSPIYGVSGYTALHFAALKGDVGLAQLLLQSAADQMELCNATDSLGKTPEMVAEAGGHEPVRQLLREALEAAQEALVKEAIECADGA